MEAETRLHPVWLLRLDYLFAIALKKFLSFSKFFLSLPIITLGPPILAVRYCKLLPLLLHLPMSQKLFLPGCHLLGCGLEFHLSNLLLQLAARREILGPLLFGIGNSLIKLCRLGLRHHLLAREQGRLGILLFLLLLLIFELLLKDMALHSVCEFKLYNLKNDLSNQKQCSNSDTSKHHQDKVGISLMTGDIESRSSHTG